MATERGVLREGTRLGPYELVASLGAGAMGEVYYARDPELDRPVAIKVLTSSRATGVQLERFQREARAVARITHPHICTVHDVGQVEGVPFLVMELLEGETLAARLEHGAGRLPGRVRRAVVRDRAAGEAGQPLVLGEPPRDTLEEIRGVSAVVVGKGNEVRLEALERDVAGAGEAPRGAQVECLDVRVGREERADAVVGVLVDDDEPERPVRLRRERAEEVLQRSGAVDRRDDEVEAEV